MKPIKTAVGSIGAEQLHAAQQVLAEILPENPTISCVLVACTNFTKGVEPLPRATVVSRPVEVGSHTHMVVALEGRSSMDAHLKSIHDAGSNASCVSTYEV